MIYRVCTGGSSGYVGVYGTGIIMEHHVEKTSEHEMETGLTYMEADTGTRSLARSEGLST